VYFRLALPPRGTLLSALSLAVVALALAGCARNTEPIPPRYAVVRFENLSGNPDFEWTGRAASELLSRTLARAMDGPVIADTAISRMTAARGDRPAAAPGISSERVAAQLSGATRLITGYVEQVASGIRLTAVEDELPTGKRVRTVSVVESSPMKALTALARAISPKAGAYETANEEAFRLYCVGREAPADTAAKDLEQAIQKDPGFGPAWEALIGIDTARGDRAAAEALLARARQQKLEPLTMANLDLESAILQGDQKAKLAALKRVSSLSPGDTVLRRSLAESESVAGQFAEAAADWQKLREVLPTDPDVWNQLGYAQAWSGDYTGAVATMEGYSKLRPDDPNPMDSLGDVHYMHRKFAEAAAVYQRNAKKFPQFLAGGDLYKAAWARYLAGDKAGADAAFAEFKKVREKSGNFALLSAEWLYGTGRRKEAIADLQKAIAENSDKAPERAAWLGQLAIWELLAGDRAIAAKHAEALGTPSGPGAFLVRFVTMPSASASEWQTRADRMMPAPALAPLRRLAVGYALLLDGKKDAAQPIWKEIADSAPGTDFALKAVYSKLRGEQPRLALPPDPSTVNPFAAVLQSIPR